MTEFKVHRVRFVEFMPKSVNSAAFDNESKDPRVALSREDGSIEIRDPKNDWVLSHLIPGQDGRTIEHLVWCSGRLFSGGLNGEVIEWNLETLQPKYTQDSYGGPVWCLKFNYGKTHLAVGCEDGSVRMFQLFDDSILYERCLHRQDNRILSLAWSHCDEHIITGGFDSSMHMYNVKTGKISSRMTLDNLKDSDTMVWAVEILQDMTVIVGDSLGNTQFWDGNTGTLIQSFKSHKADVLAVAVCDNETTVYSTGVDSKVTQFKLVRIENYTKWVQAKSIRPTNHDTRTLAVCVKPFCMVSGGVDPRFVVYDLKNFSSKTFVRYSCLPNVDAFHVSQNCLLFREQKKIHVWQLKDTEDELSKPTKLYEIQSDSSDHLLCAAMSPSGRYVAYSSLTKSRLLETNMDAATPTLEKSNMKIPLSSNICFSSKENFLVSVGFDKLIHVVDLESGEQENLNFPEDVKIQLPYLHLCVSHNEKFACVVDNLSACHLFSIKDKCYLMQLPSLESMVVSCTFHPKQNNVVLVTSKKMMYEFSIKEEKLLPFMLEVNKSEAVINMGRMKDKVSRVVFNPQKNAEIFLQTKEVIGKFVYGSDFSIVTEKTVKRKKSQEEPLKINGQFNNIMFFDFNVSGEMVVVERPMPHILEKLPSALKIKKFGS